MTANIKVESATITGTCLAVSRIGLGTWAIGGWMWGGTDEEESTRTIHAAVEGGINLIDTAPAYGFGRSEQIVGRAIADHNLRSRVVIATKTGLEWKDGKVFRNASRNRILREATDSLRRLRNDYIDIYQVHWPDPLVPIEATAEAMQTLLDQGKIRAIGVSNFSVAQIERFQRVAKLHVVQPPYNLFERKIDKELLPYCRESGLASLTYGALCRGLLSGKLQEGANFAGDDLRLTDPKFQPPRYAQYLAAVRRLDQFAQQRYGKRVIHLAVRWLLDQGATAALWGARHPSQLQPIAEVFGWSLDATAKTEIDRILRESIPIRSAPSLWPRPRVPNPQSWKRRSDAPTSSQSQLGEDHGSQKDPLSRRRFRRRLRGNGAVSGPHGARSYRACVCPGKTAGEKIKTAIHDFEGDQTYTEKRGHDFVLNASFEEAEVEDYDALMIAGGRAPEYLRLDKRLIEIVRFFAEKQRPIAAICHAAQILAAADVIRGRRVSAYPACAPEVRLAGGEYVETPPDGAIRDSNLVTGFAWPAHPQFLALLLEVLGTRVSL